MAASQPHFFKIILTDSLRLQKLSIPKKFVQRYGETFSSQVFLKLPNGAEWKVEFTRSNNMVWLDRGWHKFAKDCFLDEGHLLVFRYNRNSCFHVLIFDTSASEIEYPCNDARRDETEVIRNFQDDESSKRHEKNPPSSPRPCKKMRNENSCKVKLEIEGDDFDSMEDRGGISTPHRYSKCEVSTRRRTFYAGQKARALQRANVFKSENPFFTIVVQPSVISKNYILVLPRKFARKYFNKKCGEAKLSVSDGRTWVVSYTYYVASTVMFLHGWKKFSEDNELKVGDVCVFEMIKDVGFSFEVHIFPVSEDDHPFDPLSQVKKSEENGVQSEKSAASKLEPNITMNAEVGVSSLRDQSPSKEGYGGGSSNCAFSSENPFFKLIIKPSYVDGRSKLNVPSSFASRYLDFSKVNVLDAVLHTTSDDRTWFVKFSVRKYRMSHRVEISHGWRRFVKGNNLKVGDICVFELIKPIEMSFNIIIYRVSDSANRSLQRRGHQMVLTPLNPTHQEMDSSFMAQFKMQTRKGNEPMQVESDDESEDNDSCEKLMRRPPVKKTNKEEISKEGEELGTRKQLLLLDAKFDKMSSDIKNIFTILKNFVAQNANTRNNEQQSTASKEAATVGPEKENEQEDDQEERR